MKKRVVLYAVACCITLISALVFCPQAFSQQITMRLGHAGAPNHPYTTMAYKLADLVKSKTSGSMVITVHPASQLGGERDLVEGLQLGTVDLTIVTVGVTASFVPELNVLNLPFLFRDAKHYTEIVNGPIGKRLLKACEPKGIVGLGIFAPVFRVPMNNVRPINSPADFKGLRLRLMEVPLHMDTYRALGASPVPIPFGELYTALQLKTVDGNENALATLLSQKIYEVQKYVTILPVLSNGAILMMSQVAWNKLSPKQRDSVVESVPETLATGDREYLAMDGEGMRVMKAYGLEFNTPTDIRPFREAVKPIYAKYLAKMPDWVKEAFEQIQK